MYEGRRIAAVVPAYNEAAHIASVIATMPSIVDFIVVVDDASADDTAAIAEATGDTRLTAIRHEANTGVGGAIISGHRKALALGSDINVVFAGDAQMDPDYLTSLLDPIVHDGYGFTKANRFYSSNSFSSMPRHRVFGNVVLSLLTKMSSGYWNLFDPQNGYTAITAESLRRLDLDRVRNRYEFENDLLINLNILGVRARDVPVPAVYGDEVSSIRLRRVVPALLVTLVAGFWRRVITKYVVRTFSPVALLLFSGLALAGFGLLVGIYIITFVWSSDSPSTATVLLGVTPFLMGFQLLLAALQLDIAETPD